MKKLIISSIFILFTLTLSFADDNLNGISTILVIVEEFENGMPSQTYTPFVDGMIDALWEEPYIFFDMQIKKPLGMTNNLLHVNQYINSARESGADAILLVKFNYSSEDVEAMVRLQIEKIYYHVYSLHTLQTLAHGVEEVNMNELVELSSKNKRIKNLAFSFTQGIFN